MRINHPILLLLLVLTAALPLTGQNPLTGIYPSAIMTDSDGWCWKNNGQTTLNGAINSTTLTVVVANAANLCAPGVITIGSERMLVASIASNTLTIASGGRGYDSSTAASHAHADPVNQYVPARWLNRVTAEIKAMQTAMGVGMTNLLADPGSAGIVARKSDDTVVARTLQGTTNQIVITNPTGDGGAPVFSLANPINVDTIGTADTAEAVIEGGEIRAPRFTKYTVSILPPDATLGGRMGIVTDGANPRDCSVGGGAFTVLCYQVSTTAGPLQWEALASLEDALYHATDCTAATGGRAGDLCVELDADTLYSCQPTSGLCDTAGEWVAISGAGGGAGDVTAALNFGTDNALIRSDGTLKGVQASGVTLDDSNNLTVPGQVTAGTTSATPLVFEGATADAFEMMLGIQDPTQDQTHTIPNVASDTFTMLGAAQTLVGKTLTSPVVNTPTLGGAVTGSGTHYYDWPEIAAPASPAADTARMYAKTGATTSLCMKDSAGTETCFGSGSGTVPPTVLFERTFGHGTSAGNWNTSIHGAGCFSSTAGAGNGGTSVAAGSVTFSDADTELVECRVGRIRPGIALTNITLQIDAQQTVNDTNVFTFDFDWACLNDGDETATGMANYVDPASPVVVTKTGTAITNAEIFLMETTGVDLTQDASGCAVGDFLVVKFSRASSDTSTSNINIYGFRGYAN